MLKKLPFLIISFSYVTTPDTPYMYVCYMPVSFEQLFVSILKV